MNTSSQGIVALENISKDSSLLQSHPFVDAVSEGIGRSLYKQHTREKLLEGMNLRAEKSNLVGRDDSLPYMYNLIGHLLTYHLRNGGLEGGEEELVEYVADSDNAHNPMYSESFWFNTVEGFIDSQQQSPAWLDLILKDTQSCVPGRARSVLAGIATIAISQNHQNIFNDIDTEDIRILDFGGSTGFVSEALLDICEDPEYEVYMYRDGKRHQLPIHVSQATVVDVSDGDAREAIPGSWPRNCSIPLRVTNEEMISMYKKRLDNVRRLEDAGKLVFKRLGLGYSQEQLQSRIQTIDSNIDIALTSLHQLSPSLRDSTLETIRNNHGEDDDWAFIVSDFAHLPAFGNKKLVYAHDRWHNTKDPFPYRTFVVPAWHQGGDMRHYEVGGWRTSRCEPEEFSSTPRSLPKRLKITDITYSKDLPD